jgi:hypothetical protein
MSTRELIGTANQLYAGRAFDPGLFGITRSKGRPVSLITKVDLGTPKLAVADGIAKNWAGPALGVTKSVTAATKGTAPLNPTAALGSATIQTVDGARTCMVLDVPRNATATIDTAVGTITVTLIGYDQYRSKVVETLSIAPSGTTAAGKKAIKYLWEIRVHSTANDTGKLVQIGFGAILGLPYRIAAKSDLLSTWFDDAPDSATVVAAVATTPSATTGDVRGTIDIAGTLNGAKTLVAYLHVSDNDAATRNGLLGVSQFAG